MKRLIPLNELKIGDYVSLFPDEPFSTCIVKQIKDGMITLFRPYGTTADFSYTAGVITYIGVEDFQVPANEHKVTLYRRTELK